MHAPTRKAARPRSPALPRLAVLAASLAMGASPALAQPAPARPIPGQAAAPSESRALAAQFLERLGVGQLMQGMLPAMREMAVNVIAQKGFSAEQAGRMADEVLMPSISARMPELVKRFEVVLADVFTTDELRAILSNQDSPARRSAAAKAGQLPDRFRAEGEQWGQQVASDAMRDNADKLQRIAPGK